MVGLLEVGCPSFFDLVGHSCMLSHSDFHTLVASGVCCDSFQLGLDGHAPDGDCQ